LPATYLMIGLAILIPGPPWWKLATVAAAAM
jgi:hypothetical protein